MLVLSIDEKRRRISQITSEDSALQRMIKMTKPNDAPIFDGDEMLEKSKKTVKSRAKKYAAVARDFAAGKTISR